jgi:hypothetical protein
MSNIATTIEQSTHLLELGLDPKTADMVYLFEDREYPCVLKEPDYLDGSDTLAWSLSALLEVMPKMEADSTVCLGCVSTLIRCKSHDFMWQHDSTAAQPIIAAYEMVCWLLENNLIKKGEKDE